MIGLIFDIVRGSLVDGPGIRTTVFFKGCNLKCAWCHNPESQSFEKQMFFYKDKCISCGKCKEICPHHLEKCYYCGKCELYCPQNARQICGKEYFAEEVLKEILKDKSFYENSNGGVTFSGGESMLQIDFLEEILKKCKENGIHTAIDTAGAVPWKYFERVMPYTDLFLYDVKCISDDLHIERTGVSNKLILENLKKMSDNILSGNYKGDIIIRIPVIGGFNDNIHEMHKIVEFLKDIKYKYVELLPYHKIGEHKYEALNMDSKNFSVPEKEYIVMLRKVFNKV